MVLSLLKLIIIESSPLACVAVFRLFVPSSPGVLFLSNVFDGFKGHLSRLKLQLRSNMLLPIFIRPMMSEGWLGMLCVQPSIN